MIDPLFWLGLSLFLVALSLSTVLIIAIPTLQEVARAARSVEKLVETLNREFPPTLEAIRLTGLEINELTDEINQSVESASGIVKQVDRTLNSTKQQVQEAQISTRSLFAGVKAAWQVWNNPVAKHPFASSTRQAFNKHRMQ